jgi:hypothetical protein
MFLDPLMIIARYSHYLAVILIAIFVVISASSVWQKCIVLVSCQSISEKHLCYSILKWHKWI